jgi:hypothetical protein
MVRHTFEPAEPATNVRTDIDAPRIGAGAHKASDASKGKAGASATTAVLDCGRLPGQR